MAVADYNALIQKYKNLGYVGRDALIAASREFNELNRVHETQFAKAASASAPAPVAAPVQRPARRPVQRPAQRPAQRPVQRPVQQTRPNTSINTSQYAGGQQVSTPADAQMYDAYRRQLGNMETLWAAEDAARAQAEQLANTPVVEIPTPEVVEQPTAPIVEQPTAPVVEQPAAPVVEQPEVVYVEQPSAPAPINVDYVPPYQSMPYIPDQVNPQLPIQLPLFIGDALHPNIQYLPYELPRMPDTITDYSRLKTPWAFAGNTGLLDFLGASSPVFGW